MVNLQMPSTESDSDPIESYAQKVLLWTTGPSKAELLQRMKYQKKTKQFTFVTGRLLVDATVAAVFRYAAHPSKKNPLCFKGTARNFLLANATLHTPIAEVCKSHSYKLLHLCRCMCA